ncbi:MAG: hypothetical protein AB7Q42_01030 [Acidimicrobiia bacterium]
MKPTARSRPRLALTGWLTTLVLLVSCSSTAPANEAGGVPFEVRLEVDLSADNGPVTGTLFQVGTGSGVQIGAGITFADNSTQLASATVVTFFARSEQRDVTTQDLGTPFTEAVPFHLVVLDGRLVAVPFDEQGILPRYWDVEQSSWTELQSADPNLDDLRPVLMEIAGEALEIIGDDVWYAGERISDAIDWKGGTIMSAYFLDGALYLHVDYYDGGDQPSDSGYRVCAWSPGDQLDACADHRFGNVFWSYAAMPDHESGSLIVFGSKGEIVDVSLDGGISTVAGPNDVSNQIYSAVKFYDTWLLGHYPTGNLTSYDGHDTDQFADPPIGSQECSSEGQREAQTVGVWGGELAVGVWPWGEVWTGMPGEAWRLAARMFTGPAPCGEAAYADLVSTKPSFDFNALGQRIFGMASWSTGIAVATSAKNAQSAGALALLDPEQRAEYGRVYLLERDAEISCQLDSVPDSRLTFRLDGTSMKVIQNGNEICSRSVNADELAPISGEVVVGSGAWGPFDGELTTVT